MKEVRLDDKDRKLLKLLAGNSRTSLEKLGAAIGLGISATRKRIKRMEREGVLRYTISVDPALLGRGVLVFMLVGSTVGKEKELAEILAGWPEVCEIHEISSEGGGLLLKLRTRDQRALAKLKDRVRERVPEAHVRLLEVIRTRKESPLAV
jgi:DNA-binding Lrp family transcriptional regulator